MARCPYCSNALEKKPTRKKKCPHCGQNIYVRKGELYTENQKLEIDYKQRLENVLEVSPRQYEQAKNELEKQFGHEPLTRDVVWRILSEQVISGRTADAYFEMARLLKEEGNDPSEQYKLYAQYRGEEIKRKLLNYKNSSRITHVNYQTVNDSYVCKSCNKWAAEPVPVEVALAEMPIPHNCTSEFCRCWVTPAPRDDWEEYPEENNPIREESGLGGMIKRLFGRG